jgi:hypothetical protein
MYDIHRRSDGSKVASFTTDPYSKTIIADAGPGVRQVLKDVEDLQQMNRTVFEGTAAYPGPETDESFDPTSMEGYQDPSADYILSTIHDVLRDGYIINEVDEVQAQAERLEAAFSEGQEVDTPDGDGVIVEIRTEDFDGPDGDVEASDDDPAYVVGVESGAKVYRDSDLSDGSISVDGVDDATGDLAVEAARAGHGPSVAALKERYTQGQIDEDRFDRLVGAALKAQLDDTAEAAGDDGRQFDYPDSWDESPTPNRIILLKAWAGLGGRFTTCRRKMKGDVASPARFCASMKDRVLLWEGWRQ